MTPARAAQWKFVVINCQTMHATCTALSPRPGTFAASSLLIHLFGAMADGLYPVAKWIEQECAIVMLMVLRTNTGSTIVATAMSQSDLVERAHLSSIRRFKTPMAL